MPNTSEQKTQEKPWLWKKGVSPNPGGRPKADEHIRVLRHLSGQKIMRYLCETGDLSVETLRKRAEDPLSDSDEAAICKARVKAIEGDIRALSLIWDRILGRPDTSVILSGIDGGPILTGNSLQHLSNAELLKLLPEALEALKRGESANGRDHEPR